MGKSERFIDKIDRDIPGPNKYKISGFTDEIMKKTNSKFNKSTGVNTTHNNFYKTGKFNSTNGFSDKNKKTYYSEYPNQDKSEKEINIDEGQFDNK